MRTSDRDRGQGAVLVLVVAAAVFVALSAATVTIGSRMIDRTRAQSAADAAALASVRRGRNAAQLLAERNGATLVTFTSGPGAGHVRVVVRVGVAVASAAGTDEP